MASIIRVPTGETTMTLRLLNLAYILSGAISVVMFYAAFHGV